MGWVIVFWRHFQQYFSYIVALSFIGAGNHWPVESHWQTLSHNVLSSTPRHEWDSNSQLQWWYALIAQAIVNQTTIQSRQPRIMKYFAIIAVLSNVHFYRYIGTFIVEWNSPFRDYCTQNISQKLVSVQTFTVYSTSVIYITQKEVS